jgi:hypothetical protein
MKGHRMHQNDTIPNGFCQCGCGQKTKIANHTYNERGHIKGKPVRYVKGHWKKSGPLYIADDVTGCWEWQRAKCLIGYGRIRIDGKAMAAHRMTYEQAHGPIPDGMGLDHLCRNPSCVNPAHLEPVTHVENVRRGATPKLTMQKADQIRLLLPTMTNVEIGRRFGVSAGTISAVRTGRTWRGE